MVDQQIEVTHIADVSMIKDAANSILAHQVLPPYFFSKTHYKGPSISTEPIERSGVIPDVDVGSWGVNPITTIGNKGVMGTSAPTSASSSAPVKDSTLPLA